MSREYVCEPGVPYATLIDKLPPSIRIISPPKRCYVEGIDHVLLQDSRGHTLWLRKARAQDVYQYGARFEGEGVFEHFGLQGNMGYFAEAFEEAGFVLHGVVDGLRWDE